MFLLNYAFAKSNVQECVRICSKPHYKFYLEYFITKLVIIYFNLVQKIKNTTGFPRRGCNICSDFWHEVECYCYRQAKTDAESAQAARPFSSVSPAPPPPPPPPAHSPASQPSPRYILSL